MLSCFGLKFDCSVTKIVPITEKCDSSFKLTTQGHCHLKKLSALQVQHHKFIPEGLITWFSDVGTATMVGSNMRESLLILPSRMGTLQKHLLH